MKQGAWYGFPDFVAGMPVTEPQFKPQKAAAPDFLLKQHPQVEQPWLTLPPHCAVTQMDFSRSSSFGYEGHLFLGQVGDMQPITGNDARPVGFQVVKIDPETGRVEVDADSRLRVLTNGPGRKRLSLERGTIHATIWAPPGEFVVDTPSAVAVDLGCVYTLQVDDSGAGLLRTTLGWVGFKLDGHESFIPAGAVCATRPKIGPAVEHQRDRGDRLGRGLVSGHQQLAQHREQETRTHRFRLGVRSKPADQPVRGVAALILQGFGERQLEVQ